MTKRPASHAGSWYTEHSSTLSSQLADWLNQVDSTFAGVGELPQPGARVIIAPHAGYAYSGPAAAWAYKSLDLSKAKRIFLLGPSHHHYLTGCALSNHTHYSTPLGDLPLDLPTISSLRSTREFDDMSASTDSAEHSLEMHLPYIHHLLSTQLHPAELPPLIPILVGNTSQQTEKAYAVHLAPYLADPESVFIISSDFCHWGSRFRYTYYIPSSASHVSKGRSLTKGEHPDDPPIHESIGRIDTAAMEAVESGSHAGFWGNLKETGNTVCGRHPIGVVMAAIALLNAEGEVEEGKGRFRFVRYERSSEVVRGNDSSVSYASAFCVL